ncbi:MAG: hypothetical protein PHT69_02345 [Bacteroidales bacterium]|nr:hypothetical protein [Bacteroidales bacterium]
MELSKTNKLMVYASSKGYVVDEKGDVYYKNRKRALFKDHHGYLTFSVKMYDNEKKKDYISRVFVHKLQAFQKYGMKMFEEKIQVRHLDSIKDNNCFENIAIGTPSQNQMDRCEKERREMAISASYKRRILSDEEVKNMIEDRESGMKYKELMKKYSISSKGTLSYIINKSIYYKKNKE